MTSSSSMSETMRISREHFGHRSASASHTFLINSHHFLEGMARLVGRNADQLHGVALGLVLSPGAAVGRYYRRRLRLRIRRRVSLPYKCVAVRTT
jgi:hypothetical protein